jgi:phosphoribosyl-ATP pyrophosphohydrolase/phosphoribosyl-AMP cyclohydrolase
MNIDFSKGLVPAVIRDAASGAVLTVAFLNDEALRKTIETGETWLWSRSRGALWHKGETSGNRQRVVHIAPDCDRDAVVVTVETSGPACHRGTTSCFDGVPAPALDLGGLMRVLRERYEKRPEGSYSASLFNEGRDKILKKVGEESAEVIIAGKGESGERIVSEVADLVFHVSVLLTDAGLGWAEVGAELARRVK